MLRDLLDRMLKKEGWSRYRLSKELGISQGLLSSFFKGDKNISLKNLERIVNRLGYEILLLKKQEIQTPTGKYHKKLTVEKEIERIIENFETSKDVYVRGISVGAGKVKIDYEQGRIGTISTKGRRDRSDP